MAGTIRFKAQSATLEGIVRNISTSGARLQVSNAAWLPEQFEFDIRHQDIRIGAQVIWRGIGEAGISFLPYERQNGRSPRQDDALHRLHAERERLRARVRQLSEEM